MCGFGGSGKKEKEKGHAYLQRHPLMHMHAARKVSGSKDEGGALIPWIELRLRRSMAVWCLVNRRGDLYTQYSSTGATHGSVRV